MSFGLKSSLITNSCLTLASLFLGHFLLLPQRDSSLDPQLSASIETPFVRQNAEKSDATNGGRRGSDDDDDDENATLLSRLPEEGFYADLYVASKSYLEESDFCNETAENGAPAAPFHDPDTRSEPLDDSRDTDSALLKTISSLKRQGGQVFGTNDFSALVDVTAFFGGEGEELTDGDDGSGDDGSGEDGSGSADDDNSSGSGSGKSGDDNSSNTDCGSGVSELGSGSIASGSGQESSGSGNFESGSGQESSGSGNFDSGSGQDYSGSGSGDPREKSKKSCKVQ